MTRREWIALTGGAAAGAAPRVQEIRTISMQSDLYHGWPTVMRRRDGELLLAWSGGREAHVCPFGRLELMRSGDEGRTWSWPQVLMDSPIDDRDAGLCETPRGTLLATTFTSLAYEPILEKAKEWAPERRARWEAVQRRAQPVERKALLGCWMLRSEDGGLTWSAPYRVPVNSPHGPIALADGRLLYAGKRLWDQPAAVGVCESLDDGRTWRWLADLPVRPGDRFEAYHELHAVEAQPGRVVVQIRNHNPANERETLQTESTDGGKSWRVPRAIGVWGLPSHLLRLRDRRLLMTYGYRRAPFGNQARWSADQGQTWSEAITISADGAGGDLGYPSTVELADDALLTVWYERFKESPNAVLRMARWAL
jgi:hypothetical protein